MRYIPHVLSRFLINFHLTDQPGNILNFFKSLKPRCENAKERRRKETIVLIVTL